MIALRFLLIIFGIYSFLSIGVITLLNISNIQYNYNNRNIKVCGSILDRHNIPIASTIERYNLYVTDEITLKQLLNLLNLLNITDRNSIINQYHEGKKFISIKNKISSELKEKINISIKSRGIGFQKIYNRLYPHKNLFSHIIGMRTYDDHGILGIEKICNLHDIVYTTLDTQLQYYLHQSLLKYMNIFSADAAFGIILNSNGEIESSVSLPDFNSNIPTNLNHFNYALQGLYEFGSIMKIMTFAMGLENNIQENTLYNDIPKYFKIDKFYIKDVHHYNTLTMRRAFTTSSNIVSAMIAKKIGYEKHYEFLHRIGLFDRIKIDDCFNIKHARYSTIFGNVLSQSFAYGYGISITPIQMIYMIRNILSGNQILPSIIKKKQLQQEKDIYQYGRRMIQLLITDNNLPGLIGFKTGTSKIVVDGSYSDTNHFFSCFALIGNTKQPKYLLIGLINPDKQDNRRLLSIQYTYPVIKDFINNAYSALWD